MNENLFEIPQAMRDLAEQDLTHAHAGDFENKTARVGMAAMPSPMAASFKDVRERAMDFAKENAESACAFAGKVCNAKTPQEILTLQTRFAQDRTQTFTKNTQELCGLIGETVQKSGRS
jgi:phasin family protein